jgi:hypothetical protein
MPLSADKLAKNDLKALRPPAEAPMPTIMGLAPDFSIFELVPALSRGLSFTGHVPRIQDGRFRLLTLTYIIV